MISLSCSRLPLHGHQVSCHVPFTNGGIKPDAADMGCRRDCKHDNALLQFASKPCGLLCAFASHLSHEKLLHVTGILPC